MSRLTIALFFVGLLLASCGTPKQGQSIAGRYGDTTWSATEAISSDELALALVGEDSLNTQVTGTINAVCQAKGCWLKMGVGSNDMLVRFKDYGFFVPMNSAEHKATLTGWAYTDTLSVADQVEIAKDSEASEEEIAAITEPKVRLTFMADGVIIE